MLPESSSVNMMFGLTGFRPCSGTLGEHAVGNRRRVRAQRLQHQRRGHAAAQNLESADGRDEIMVLLLGNRGWRAGYCRIACAYATVLRGPSTRTVTR